MRCPLCTCNKWASLTSLIIGFCTRKKESSLYICCAWSDSEGSVCHAGTDEAKWPLWCWWWIYEVLLGIQKYVSFSLSRSDSLWACEPFLWDQCRIEAREDFFSFSLFLHITHTVLHELCCMTWICNMNKSWLIRLISCKAGISILLYAGELNYPLTLKKPCNKGPTKQKNMSTTSVDKHYIHTFPPSYKRMLGSNRFGKWSLIQSKWRSPVNQDAFTWKQIYFIIEASNA